MKITLGQLREEIRRTLAGSHPDEAYSEELLNDPFFDEKSVYVPDDIKKSIKSWAKDMKLSTK
jgi:hypothetical protein